MMTILKIISWSGLLLTIAPSFFVFSGTIQIEQHYTLMLIGAVVWFASAPFWMLRKKQS